MVGALVYFLRRVMHDWSDKYCVRILERLREAMAEHSRILIMDQILENPPSRVTAATDVALLSAGAGERDVERWYGLVGKVGGLEVLKIWRNPVSPMGVVEVKKL